MCGRFSLVVELADLAELLPGLEVPEAPPPRFNVAPTQDAAVVPNDERRALRYFRWGLVPSWAKDVAIGSRLINARAETLAEKPSFRRPLKARRCAVLASGFYEWRKGPSGKEPVHVSLATGKPFAMAGLWDAWRDEQGKTLRTFTIVTTEANELIAKVHDRMPVILSREALDDWLDPRERSAEDLLPLLRPCPPEILAARPVSRVVNDARHDAPDCLAPPG